MENYKFKAVQTMVTDYYVQSPNFANAADFVKDWVNSCLTKQQHLPLDVEINPLAKSNVIEMKYTKLPIDIQITTQKDEDDLKQMHFKPKGYDIEKNAYIFSVIESYALEGNMEAKTKEDVIKSLKKYTDEKYLLSHFQGFGGTKTPEIKILSCGENKRVVLDGEDSVEIVNQKQFVNALKEKFPQQLTIRIADEALENIVEWEDICYNDRDESPELDGLANPKDGELNGVGELEVYMILKPDCYDGVYASVNTYYSSDLSELRFDVDVNAASILMHCDEWEKEFRVDIPLQEKILNCLYIEGFSYRDFMNLVNENNFKTDLDVKSYIAQKFNEKQPDALIRYATDKIAGKTLEEWEKKVAPAYNEAQKWYAKYNTALSQALTSKKCETISELMNRENDTVVNNILNLQKIYISSSQKANQSRDEFLKNKQVNIMRYIKTLQNVAAEKVEDIRVYPDRRGNWYIRCKIDGVQQSAKPLSNQDVKGYSKSGISKEVATNWALKYYITDIDQEKSKELTFKR